MPSNTFYGMQHLNSNVLCGVKTELTGPDPNKHEIIEVAIVPFNVLFELHTTYPLFNLTMVPDEKQPEDGFEKCRLPKSRIAEICLKSFDKDKVADMLWDWFESLKLPRGKKLFPLAYNYPAERQIMINWLGHSLYSDIFSENYRDVLVMANLINDRLCARAEPVQFYKQELCWIAKQCNAVPMQRGTALSDAFLYGECYKRMLQM